MVPVTEPQRNDFFDTLYHARAIVGLNTSAQIEAAIVGRPVLVSIDPEVPAAREGTLETVHFRHLSDPEHGLVSIAQTPEEHLAQLSETLRQPKTERGRKFIHEFVRPHGLDRPAALFLADAIERGATTRTRAEVTNPLLLPLRLLLFFMRPLLVTLFKERTRAQDLLTEKPWLRKFAEKTVVSKPAEGEAAQ